jgi:hypothetical protein
MSEAKAWRGVAQFPRPNRCCPRESVGTQSKAEVPRGAPAKQNPVPQDDSAAGLLQRRRNEHVVLREFVRARRTQFA